MTAKIAARRGITASAMAADLGVSPRTIRLRHAEPRAAYEERASLRRQGAAALRQQGASYVEIADTLGTTRGAVASLLHYARRHGEFVAQDSQETS